MESVSMKSAKTIRTYNALMCFLGIHTKLLEFNEFIDHQTPQLKKSLLKLASIIIFIGFVLHYPQLASTIISHMPFGDSKKHIEFFAYYAHFYVKFVVIILIYTFELLKEKSTIYHQTNIERILLRIDKIYTYWSARSNNKIQFKSRDLRDTLIKLNCVTKCSLFCIISVIFCCILFNTIKYSYAFQSCEKDYFFDIFFGSLPNLFISSFVLHSSTTIVQYTKLFRLLDNIVDIIASDIANQMAEMEKERQNLMDKISVIRFNPSMDGHQLQLAINNISTLTETHNALRANISKLHKYNSMQLNAVILNAFFNIIFEVIIRIFLN